MNNSVSEILKEMDQRTERLIRKYGLSRRAASNLARFDVENVENALKLLIRLGRAGKMKNVGPVTEAEIHTWAGYQPQVFKHRCPECGHFFNDNEGSIL